MCQRRATNCQYPCICDNDSGGDTVPVGGYNMSLSISDVNGNLAKKLHISKIHRRRRTGLYIFIISCLITPRRRYIYMTKVRHYDKHYIKTK